MVGAASQRRVAVIGAGSSGLAVLKALREHEIDVECFERGSEVGGLWQYENDNGLSGAYASLRTNVSRSRMQYPSFPMPGSYDDFPHHTDMASYLSGYARTFGLLDLIRFRVTVERLEAKPRGGWRLVLDDGTEHSYEAVVVATGVFSHPKAPVYSGSFAGEVSHSHAYRTPAPFAGHRVLVVGGGQSAAEIAVEIAGVAEATFLSVRGGVHVVPRWLGSRPYDADDVAPLNRIAWPLLNSIFAARVARELGPIPPSLPLPSRRLLEGIPIVSSTLLPAIRHGDVVVKPAVEQLVGDGVGFVDDSEEEVDRIVYAIGYQLRIPFLTAPRANGVRGRELPLYRRIVPPELTGLYFAGFVDAPGGLLPVVEAQGEWIATVLSGGLSLPDATRMWRAIDRSEKRTRERFPDESPRSIRCDPHAYRRLLRSDVRKDRVPHGRWRKSAVRRLSNRRAPALCAQAGRTGHADRALRP